MNLPLDEITRACLREDGYLMLDDDGNERIIGLTHKESLYWCDCQFRYGSYWFLPDDLDSPEIREYERIRLLYFVAIGRLNNAKNEAASNTFPLH